MARIENSEGNTLLDQEGLGLLQCAQPLPPDRIGEVPELVEPDSRPINTASDEIVARRFGYRLYQATLFVKSWKSRGQRDPRRS